MQLDWNLANLTTVEVWQELDFCESQILDLPERNSETTVTADMPTLEN